jgi:hypothetical protein
LLVDFVSFLIISLVCGAVNEAVLVVEVLELFKIDVWLFTPAGLRLAANTGFRVQK